MSDILIINKTIKDLKRELRRYNYNYINKYLSVNFFKELYKSSKTRIINDKIHFNLDDLDITYSQKENIKKRFSSNNLLFKLSNDYVFNEDLSRVITDYFSLINNKIKNNNVFKLKGEEEKEDGINNLFTVDEFKSTFNKEVKYNPDEKNYTFIPNKYLELSNIHTLINKYSKFRFSLNSNLDVKKDKDFNFNTINKVNKFHINIKRKVYADGHVDKLVSEFVYVCPRCFEKIFLLPNETYKVIKHGCEGYITASGVQKYQIIQADNKASSNSKELTLYEFTIDDESTIRYAYSFNPRINPGKYEADILLTCDSLNGGSKKNLAIILGIEKIKFKEIKDLVVSDEAKEWCNKNNLPYIRFLDTLFSIRKLHRTYTKHIINDKGMLNQIFVTLSGLAKSLFKHRAVGVSVIGNKSLSKTYTGCMFAMALDRDYVYVQNSTDVTVPGLKGGINNKKDINGVMTTVFEPGLFTRGGLTVFDEGDKYYSDDALNTSLKDLFNNKISIFKIGGLQGIKQNYTPIIYANFKFNKTDYMNHVKNVYNIIIRDKEAIVPHAKTEREVVRYLNNIDLYLPLSYYVDTEANEHLARSIAYVRDFMKRNDKDWRTGGSLPSSYRLLLDVVCNNVDQTFEKSGKRECKRTEVILPEIYDLPYEEFIQALKDYYNIHNIDLYKLNNNSDIVNSRLELLFADIDRFLVEEGKDIHIHLSNNSKKIDEKLLNVVSTVISILQLLENPESIKLDNNVKEWAHLILLKCKRGITEEEYDFKSHRRYRFIRFDTSDTIGDIDSIKEDRLFESVAKKVKEKLDNDGIEVDLDE